MHLSAAVGHLLKEKKIEITEKKVFENYKKASQILRALKGIFWMEIGKKGLQIQVLRCRRRKGKEIIEL